MAQVMTDAVADTMPSELRDHEELSLSALGVQRPAIPGDVFLAGRLPVKAGLEIASQCKSWICLLPEEQQNKEDKDFFKALADADLHVTHHPFSGPDVQSSTVSNLLEAIKSLPRPLLISCASSNRAGAVLLLHLALERRCTAESAKQLAEDLDIYTFTRCTTCGPMRDWVFSQLPGGQALQDLTFKQELKGVVVQQLFDPSSSTFTYVIGCRATSTALLLDPVLEQKDRDLQVLKELGLELRYVLNTHVHADHVTSGALIRKDQPSVRTIISEASGAKSDLKVKHGEMISVGSIQLEVRATPGHTNGCSTFVLRPCDGPAMAFTGDALLIRGCGRTDFQQGDSSSLHDSVHSQIFSLPQDTLIYPAHDYKGRNVSTVGEEMRYNARLTKSKEEFSKIMSELGLPYPKKIDVAVPANMLCGVQD